MQDSAKFYLDANKAIYFSPKKQKEEERTPRNIKNPGSYQGAQSWKD